MSTAKTFELDGILIRESEKPSTLKKYPEDLYFLDIFELEGDDGPYRKVRTAPSGVAFIGYICIFRCRHDKNEKAYAAAVIQVEPTSWIKTNKRTAAYELLLSIKCSLIPNDFYPHHLFWWSHNSEPKILLVDDKQLKPDRLLLFYTDLPLITQRIEYGVLNVCDTGFVQEIRGPAIPLLRLERFSRYNENRRRAVAKREEWDAKVASAKKEILTFAPHVQSIMELY